MTTLRRRRRRPAGVALALVVLTLWPAPAQAQQSEPTDGATDDARGDPQFAVQPSGPEGPGDRDWFNYTLDPGEVFGDTVAVSNLGSTSITFEIVPSDAESVAGSGGFAALENPAESTGVGTWIELAAGDYTVAPGERIDVPFSITVPEDAEPGDHAGAILAADAAAGAFDPDGGPDGLSFDVRFRLGARVYVRVGGEIAPALRIDELAVDHDGDQAIVSWSVANTGNIRLESTARVRITGWLGRTVATAPAQAVPELLPNATYSGATVLTGMPSFEPLTAHLELEAPEIRTERSVRFAPYPWLLLAPLVLLIGGAVWWFRRRRRRRQQQGTAPSPRRPDRVAVPA